MKDELLEESSSPVTCGQVCAMYDGEKQVIGSGIISQVVRTCGENGDTNMTG
jgi:tRNA U34 2-thiouridine synthase MnmA/TrmU